MTLTGTIGVGVDSSQLKQQTTYCPTNSICLKVNDNVDLSITTVSDQFVVNWTSNARSQVFQDCYDLSTDKLHWYGGPERWIQDWPIEKLKLTDFANVAQEKNFSAIVEPYWLNSLGSYIFVDDEVPLFIDQNGDTTANKVCFSAKNDGPFVTRRKDVELLYNIYVGKDPKKAHLHAVENHLGKPTGEVASLMSPIIP